MRLGRIVFRDSPRWLEADTEINPEVGTIVQVTAYPNEGSDWGHAIYFPGWEHAIYFPGSQAPYIISPLIFELYFEWLE